MIPLPQFKVGEVPSVTDGIRRRVVTSGQYAGLTYEQILANDPDYCQWHLENLRDDDEGGLALADWLRDGDRVGKKRKLARLEEDEEPLQHKRDWPMDFGKFKDQNKTYGEVFDNNPMYCQVLLEKRDAKLVGANERRFLTFVKQTGAALDEQIRRVRERRRAENEAPPAPRAPAESASDSD